MSQVFVVDHVDDDAAHADRALHAKGDMIGIVTDPDRHFFSAFKDGALNEKRFKLDSTEFRVFCSYRLFTQIPDI